MCMCVCERETEKNLFGIFISYTQNIILLLRKVTAQFTFFLPSNGYFQ